jgi:hypothetical protein
METAIINFTDDPNYKLVPKIVDRNPQTLRGLKNKIDKLLEDKPELAEKPVVVETLTYDEILTYQAVHDILYEADEDRVEINIEFNGISKED